MAQRQMGRWYRPRRLTAAQRKEEQQRKAEAQARAEARRQETARIRAQRLAQAIARALAGLSEEDQAAIAHDLPLTEESRAAWDRLCDALPDDQWVAAGCE